MEEGSAFFGKGCCENVRVQSSREKEDWKKTRQKLGCQLLLSKEVILGHPCVPRVRLTGLAIRRKPEKQGAELVRGGGRG
jgi:hypothetical protein